MKIIIAAAVSIVTIGGLILALANEVGRFCEETNPYGADDFQRDIENYKQEIENNPHIFCYNTCCIKECPKHKDNVVLDNQYLYALMKDTIYCPYQEEE